MPPKFKESLRLIVQDIQNKRASGKYNSSYEKRAIEALKTWITKAQEYKSQVSSQPAPKGADLLWILSGQRPEVFQKYLATAPDPQLNELSQQPERLQNVISNLLQTVTPSVGEPSQDVAPAPLQSSNIYGFQYDPRTKRLLVKFQGNKGLGQGPVYQYEGVPGYIANLFRMGAVSAKTAGRNKWGAWWKFKNPSLGATHYALIRDIFPYQRIA